MSGRVTHEQARAVLDAVCAILGPRITVTVVAAIPATEDEESGVYLEVVANVNAEIQVSLLEAAVGQLQDTDDESIEREVVDQIPRIKQ